MKQKLKAVFTENRILFVVETISFCLLVFWGIMWIVNPEKSYEPYITVAGFVFLGLEIYRRYKKNKSVLQLHIDTANTIFCKYKTSKQPNDKTFALLLYDLKISNDSETNCTIKDVKIEYALNNNIKQSDSIVLITGSVYSPQIKSNVDSILIKRPSDEIVIMNWYNLKQVIAQSNCLIAGGIMRGSCLFIMELNDMEELKNIETLNVVITDYKGNQSKHLLNIRNEWWQPWRNSYVEYDNSFIK